MTNTPQAAWDRARSKRSTNVYWDGGGSDKVGDSAVTSMYTPCPAASTMRGAFNQ